jgi:hypothetical protein
LTRPKLGFELGPGEKKGQIGEARPVGEGRKFSAELGNIGRRALRALDNLRDFNSFAVFSPVETRLSLRASDAGFFIFHSHLFVKCYLFVRISWRVCKGF